MLLCTCIFLFYPTMSECMIFYGPTVPEINYSILLLEIHHHNIFRDFSNPTKYFTTNSPV